MSEDKQYFGRFLTILFALGLFVLGMYLISHGGSLSVVFGIFGLVFGCALGYKAVIND